MATLSINKYYEFSLYPNTVIGINFKNAKLTAILDYKKAIKFANIDLYQKQIYPYLPPNTPSNHRNYTYYLFEVNGKDVVIADTWIIPTSIVESQSASYILKLNNISETQLAIVRDQLRVLGINFEII